MLILGEKRKKSIQFSSKQFSVPLWRNFQRGGTVKPSGKCWADKSSLDGPFFCAPDNDSNKLVTTLVCIIIARCCCCCSTICFYDENQENPKDAQEYKVFVDLFLPPPSQPIEARRNFYYSGWCFFPSALQQFYCELLVKEGTASRPQKWMTCREKERESQKAQKFPAFCFHILPFS